MLTDAFGRTIDYLRVSVTTRCNLNCVYCGKQDCEKKDAELTVAQIETLVRAFARCGIRKVRVTGGEPLVRSDIRDIVAAIAHTPGIETVGLTTNGGLLAPLAKTLADAGLQSVNVSLDSTDGSTYRHLTGADVLQRVLDGIAAAQTAGLSPIKLNAVLMKGVNADGAGALIALAKNAPIDVRFIELMPFSDAGESDALRVTGDELLRQFSFLTPLEGEEKETARYYTAPGYGGRIGFISPVSHKFCERCNRVRLLANGSVRLCLAAEETYDLTAYLNDEAALEKEIRRLILKKPAAHLFGSSAPKHGLNRTGG